MIVTNQGKALLTQRLIDGGPIMVQTRAKTTSKQIEAIRNLIPKEGLPPMSYHTFVNKIREIVV